MFDFVYTLASANIDQSAPNLATVYMPIRSRISSNMGQIEQENPELFALEFGKIAYKLISTKLSQSVYDHKILDEFDYGTHQTAV